MNHERRLDACIPFGDEGELVVVAGWFPRLQVRSWVIQRLQRELGVTEDWSEAVEELGVEQRGFARFWKENEANSPYDSDGGVSISKRWKWGYLPATWLYEH